MRRNWKKKKKKEMEEAIVMGLNCNTLYLLLVRVWFYFSLRGLQCKKWKVLGFNYVVYNTLTGHYFSLFRVIGYMRAYPRGWQLPFNGIGFEKGDVERRTNESKTDADRGQTLETLRLVDRGHSVLVPDWLVWWWLERGRGSDGR